MQAAYVFENMSHQRQCNVMTLHRHCYNIRSRLSVGLVIFIRAGRIPVLMLLFKMNLYVLETAQVM